MATNPLAPVAPIELGSNLMGAGGDPFSPGGLSQWAWDQMHPQQQADYLADMLTGSGSNVDRGGNFNEKSKLDTSQVESSDFHPMPVNPSGFPQTGMGPPSRVTKAEAAKVARSMNFKTVGPGITNDRLGPIPADVLAAHTGGIPETILPGAAGSWVRQYGLVDAPPGSGARHLIPPVAKDRSRYTYVSDDPKAADSILKTAQSMLGRPYQWGGSGPNAADCSGLVQYAYRQAGKGDLLRGRVVGDQMRSGVRVPLSELKPGDLVAWDTGYLGSRGAGGDHIALYAGNGMVIAADNTRVGIRMRPLSQDFNPNQMWGVRIPTGERRSTTTARPSGAAGPRTAASLSGKQQASVQNFNKAAKGLAERVGSLFGGSDRKPAQHSSTNRSSGSSKSNSSNRSNGSSGGGKQIGHATKPAPSRSSGGSGGRKQIGHAKKRPSSSRRRGR